MCKKYYSKKHWIFWKLNKSLESLVFLRYNFDMNSYQPTIIVDVDPELSFETNGVLRKIFNFFAIPLLNSLPKNLRGVVKNTHKSAKNIIEKATSHAAIEILYKDGQPELSKSIVERFFYNIWFTTSNPKAVRNRLKIVERELRKALNHLVSTHLKDDVRILSVASGSARAIVDGIKGESFSPLSLHITLLDKSEEALNYSRSLVGNANFPDNFSFRWVSGTANSFPEFFQSEKPDIIETVGLMDYFNDEQVLRFFTTVFENLSENGIFITANISDNPERKFVTDLVGWKMIYREPESFIELAKKAGFDTKNIKIYYEPLQIHFVMVVQK